MLELTQVKLQLLEMFQSPILLGLNINLRRFFFYIPAEPITHNLTEVSGVATLVLCCENAAICLVESMLMQTY